MEQDTIERVRDRLLEQAELFNEPQSYAAGVEDALELLINLDRGDHDELPPRGGWFG